jgi:hypothetical protein
VLTAFSGLIVYAWHRYGINDCADLGSLAETPPWAGLIENARLGILVVGILGSKTTAPGASATRYLLAMALLAAGGLAAALAILRRTRG